MLVGGDLRFDTHTNKETGQSRETRDIVADNVGASLKFANVDLERNPKAEGPAANAVSACAWFIGQSGVPSERDAEALLHIGVKQG